jgi:hypothetical protein
MSEGEKPAYFINRPLDDDTAVCVRLAHFNWPLLSRYAFPDPVERGIMGYIISNMHANGEAVTWVRFTPLPEQRLALEKLVREGYLAAPEIPETENVFTATAKAFVRIDNRPGFPPPPRSSKEEEFHRVVKKLPGATP